VINGTKQVEEEVPLHRDQRSMTTVGFGTVESTASSSKGKRGSVTGTRGLLNGK
jgi:hypothetical protein